MKKVFPWRIRIIFIGVLCVGLILIGKLYFLQIIHGSEFGDRAERQYISPTQTIFNRGSIYFSAKDGSLLSAATLKTGYILAVSPKNLIDPEKTYDAISKILPIDQVTFFAKTSKKDDPYEEIEKHIDESTAQKIDALKITGVGLYKEKWRYYPSDELASHALGFIGFDKDGAVTGRYGLERQYEDVLNRSDDNLYVNFFAEIFSNIKRSAVSGERQQGDIVTTIEPTVEQYLEKMLAKVDATWHSKQTGGIVIDPMTGEIFAIAARPFFNPNNFGSVKDVGVFKNPLVENVYELGSIIKPLTMAAGIDSGAITRTSTYNDTGTITIDKLRISNYDGKARGVVPMQEILSQSLNVGATYIERTMGNEAFANYMFAYGFGAKTGIDLPNEAEGLVKNLKNGRDVEYATAAFGQGIALSPIETVRALSAIANGGTLITPHVTKRIDYRIGLSSSPFNNDSGKRVLKEETASQVTSMLVQVVDKALAGGAAKLEHWSIAAKTGTAQIAKPGGGYYTDKYLHSFFGYFPAYKPRFMVFLFTVEPQGAQYASHTLTEPFAELAKFLLSYYEVPPDR